MWSSRPTHKKSQQTRNPDMDITYTWKQLGAQAMHKRPGFFFTAAGGNGYRLYTGTPEALTSAGFFRTYDELFAAAEAAA